MLANIKISLALETDRFLTWDSSIVQAIRGQDCSRLVIMLLSFGDNSFWQIATKP